MSYNGFDMIDTSANPCPVQCDNHKSAEHGSPLYLQATEQVLKEIISPMGVIPKPDGGVRLIHDCSQPAGKSVNDYCTTDWKQTFSRVDDAAGLVTERC